MVKNRLLNVGMVLLIILFISWEIMANGNHEENSHHSLTAPIPIPVQQTVIMNLDDKRIDCANALAGTTTAHKSHGKGHNSIGFSSSGGCQAVNYSYHDNDWTIEAKASEDAATVSGAFSF